MSRSGYVDDCTHLEQLSTPPSSHDVRQALRDALSAAWDAGFWSWPNAHQPTREAQRAAYLGGVDLSALLAEPPAAQEEKIRRYDLITNYRAGSSIEEMEPSDDGDWVRWEDVAARLVSPSPAPDGCTWTEDQWGVHRSACGQSFAFDCGDLGGFKYCPYCSKPLIEVPHHGEERT